MAYELIRNPEPLAVEAWGILSYLKKTTDKAYFFTLKGEIRENALKRLQKEVDEFVKSPPFEEKA